jgi:hypothetical protein
MLRGELVTLNMRELDRLKVIQAIVETGLKPGQPRLHLRTPRSLAARRSSFSA